MAHFAKLVPQCSLNCSEDKQIQITENVLRGLQGQHDPNANDVGYLLLSKILEKCGSQCLRSVQSRLSKQLIPIGRNPTFSGGLLLRQLLIRNPQVGELYPQPIETIILRLVDLAITSRDTMVKKLALELFGLRYGVSRSADILLTIDSITKEKLIPETQRAGLLDIRCYGVVSYRDILLNMLLDLLSTTLEYAKAEEYVARKPLLSVLEQVYGNRRQKDACLRLISALAINARYAILPSISSIVSMLVLRRSTPRASFYDTLATLCDLFGPGSTVYRHFYLLFSTVAHPMDNEISAAGGRMLASIISTSSHLIQPEVLASVQRSILENALRYYQFEAYDTVIEALLSCTHELVSPPIHVARTLLSRRSSAGVSSCSRLSALCDVIGRPRLQNLAKLEVQRRMETASRTALNSNQDAKKGFNVELVAASNEDHLKKIREMIIDTVDVDSDESDDDVVEVLDACELADRNIARNEDTIEKSVADVETSSATGKRMSSEAALPAEPSKKKTKKIRSAAEVFAQASVTAASTTTATSTILKEGEESVDDIMASFDL